MTSATTAAPALGRRERRRAETVEEIHATARRLLVERGQHEALSLRAIAREMGMTAPALYRYFDSHEALVEALVGELYDELCDAMERAALAVTAVDREVGDDPELGPIARLVAASKTFRSWSVAHPAEFGLVFGAPIPGVDLMDENSPACLASYRDELGVDLPVPVVYVFLSCWARLYGLVTIEVFGHLQFALGDPEPAFDTELHQIGVQLGIADAGERVWGAAMAAVDAALGAPTSRPASPTTS